MLFLASGPQPVVMSLEMRRARSVDGSAALDVRSPEAENRFHGV